MTKTRKNQKAVTKALAVLLLLSGFFNLKFTVFTLTLDGTAIERDADRNITFRDIVLSQKNEFPAFTLMQCRGMNFTAFPVVDTLKCIFEKTFPPQLANSASNLPVIDIVSKGSYKNLELLISQSKTWASHVSVRLFLAPTELDEADPKCHEKLTRELMVRIINHCKSRKVKTLYKNLGTGVLNLNNYMSIKWTENKSPGWFCANLRTGAVFGKLGRIYRSLVHIEDRFRDQISSWVGSSFSPSLPDYLIYLDDDGYFNLESLFGVSGEGLIPRKQNQSSSIPTVYGGCVVKSPLHESNFTFPFGGFGTIFSRGAIEMMIKPLMCEETWRRNTDSLVENLRFDEGRIDDFEPHACAQISSNTFGEQPSFVDGMSISDLMGAHSSRQNYTSVSFFEDPYPLCFHEDWMTGYYANYFHLGRRVIDFGGWEQLHYGRPGFRIDMSLGSIYKTSEGNCKHSIGKECTRTMEICHKMSIDDMKRVNNEVRYTAMRGSFRDGLPDSPRK